MSTLIATRGLQGSGKSTWARAWVAEDIGGRARVNKDDLRAMVHDSIHITGVTEQRINTARDAAITSLLRAGLDVVCDDTNLPQRVIRDLATLAAKEGAGFEVRDFTGVPLEVCIERDAARPRPVGEKVIRATHDRFLKGRALPLPLPEPATDRLVPYTPPEKGSKAPRAVLVDVDGTLAEMNGRSPYDETRVGEDLPNMPVIRAAQAMYWRGWELVIMSGRSDACRDATVAWLHRHLGVPFTGPFMRASGDQRADWRVKADLFDEHVRHEYQVEFVLDDRDQVVQMWRRLGLTVFQVAEGNF
ncbi:AAA family ATPase [Nonomuraea dietziae]|uniref:phosphatase domain-containing protein n=1 Tax=Nonomuraea dietziae TaxID=65515 RepID=UPI0033F59F37